jgi:peroxiredoxin Q/BCP
VEGEKAPAFTLANKENKQVSLDSIDAEYIVLFFYPKDDTPGCTLEAKGFNAYQAEFEKKNVELLGISGGDKRSKEKFCKKHSLDLNLLIDSDFEVATRYQAYGEKKFMGRTFEGIHRKTFILDRDKTILKVFEKVSPKNHPQEVLAFLEEI